MLGEKPVGRVDRAAAGMMTSILQYALQILLQLMLAPLVLLKAGQETLGAYVILMQAVGYLTLLDMGFSLAIARYLPQAYAQEDKGDRFKIVIVTGRSFLLLSNTLFAAAALVLSAFLDSLVHFSPQIGSQARLGLVIVGIWAVIRTPWAMYGPGLLATQNLARANMIATASNAARLAFALTAVSMHTGLVGLMLANVLGEMLGLTLYTYHFKRKYKDEANKWGIPDKSLFLEMALYGAKAMFINAGWRLIALSDNLVVGYLRGAVAASVYYTTQMPATLGYNLVNRLSDNFGPAINELHAKADMSTLRSFYLGLHRYTALVVAPMALGLLLLNERAITLWVGPSQYAGSVMTGALATFMVLICMAHVNVVFVMAAGRIEIFGVLTLFEGLVNLGLSFWLGSAIGISGVMVATAIAALITSSYLQVRNMREMHISMMQYLQTCLLPAVLPSIGLVSTGLSLQKWTISHGWGAFIVTVIFCITVYSGLMIVFSMRPNERRWAYGWVSALIGQRRDA